MLKNRHGKFTSSEIYKLIKSGQGKNEFSAPGLTYIEEKSIERKIDRSLSLNAYSKDMAWGTIMEIFAHRLMPIEGNYDYISNDTFIHPKYEFWSGTPDMMVQGKKISEIKCYQLKRFSQYTDMILKKDIDLFKKEFPKEYWQIVSNCAIHSLNVGEAVSYMPYESDLIGIIEEITMTDFLNINDLIEWHYRFIADPNVEFTDLPYLKNDGYYKNLNVFEFEIPKEDFELLEIRVLKAEEYLKNNY